MRLSFLPKEFLQNAKCTLTINNASYMIDNSDTIYEIAEIDRPHSSWFVGDECVQNGCAVVALKINPIFLVINWISNKGKEMFLIDDMFDGEFEPIKQILTRYVCCVCDYLDVGDGPLFFFSEKKTKEYIINKISKLMESDVIKNDDENISVESAFDIIKHYISKSVEIIIRDELKKKYPKAFVPKKIELKYEEKQNSPKKRGRKPKQVQKENGVIPISSFFVIKKSKE